MSHGMLIRDLLHIPVMKAPASVMVSTRKIIQPNTARVNVNSILAASRKEGSIFALVVPSGKVMVATVSLYRRFLPRSINGRNKKAW